MPPGPCWYHPWPLHHERGGKVGRGAAVVAIVAAALTMASTASPWSRQAMLEQRAATLTGLRAPIVCETAFEHAQGVKAGGTAYYGFTLTTSPRLVVLAPSVCRLLRTADRETPAFAFAVWVLAHELGHVVRATNDETARRVLRDGALDPACGSIGACRAYARPGRSRGGWARRIARAVPARLLLTHWTVRVPQRLSLSVSSARMRVGISSTTWTKP